MRLRLWYVSLIITLLIVLVIGFGGQPTSPHSLLTSQIILGRWKVFENSGISRPHSFFWFNMDYIEFREDGKVLGLIQWPPPAGSDIRLNVTARYSVVDQYQVEFTGSCRHQDVCTGVYTTTLNANTLRIFGESGKLTLVRIGPPSGDLPPAVVAPFPSPTAAVKH